MKRLGFVSNSSSSSFIMIGIKLTKDVVLKSDAFKEFCKSEAPGVPLKTIYEDNMGTFKHKWLPDRKGIHTIEFDSHDYMGITYYDNCDADAVDLSEAIDKAKSQILSNGFGKVEISDLKLLSGTEDY